jgi:hypothetical protein
MTAAVVSRKFSTARAARLALFIAPVTCWPLAPALAQQPRSIVGKWHFPGQGCGRDDGAIIIGPMSLEGEDVLCKFTSVKREGNRVTWKGSCDSSGEGSSRETVTATETAKGLTIRYHPGGNVLEGLQRCPR